MLGKTLSHYRIDRRIGAGGMGEVYRARDTKLQRDVAIKVLPAEHARDPVRRSRFEREALAVAALRHPNVVTIHAVEDVDGVAFLVMELVEGATLSHAIPPGGFAAESFLPIATAVADALAAAHARGIVHRDLKPSNVMLDADGRPRVLDFGLARFSDESPEGETRVRSDAVTRDGQLLGTVLYMSPEQARGEPVDARSDVFSAGVLFYEALTGTRPFEGTTTADSIGKLLHAAPEPLPPGVPPELSALVMRCLEKDPARRPADGAGLLEALRGIAAPAARSEASATHRTDDDGSLPRVRSVAVMPFAARAGNDDETEFLCDGLTESRTRKGTRFCSSAAWRRPPPGSATPSPSIPTGRGVRSRSRGRTRSWNGSTTRWSTRRTRRRCCTEPEPRSRTRGWDTSTAGPGWRTEPAGCWSRSRA